MSLQDAQAALTRFNSFEKFTISSKPVMVDYIHAGVFVPVFHATESKEKYTFSPYGNSSTKLAYWDEEAWVSELTVSSTTPQETVISNESQTRSASDRAAAAAEKEGLVKPGKETESKAKKRKVESSDASKAKKVGFLFASSLLILTILDCPGPFTVLEQSSCRASWSNAQLANRGNQTRWGFECQYTHRIETAWR